MRLIAWWLGPPLDEGEPINLGSGLEITIKDLTELICDLCNYSGAIQWDHTKPDGQPRRLLDSSKAQAKFGFSAPTDFRTGLRETIRWYEGVRSQQETAISLCWMEIVLVWPKQ